MDIKKIKEVIEIIKKKKYKAYLVGGSSRDFLLQRNFYDVDIATSAPLNIIKSLFEVVEDKGNNLGSIKINYKGIIIDITRFRIETYDDSIYPHISEFVDDEEIDAKRRDFTINAIYLDLTNNEIVDPYNGIKDLFSYTLRLIGDVNIRIKEDPTRILRGLRIASKLNFIIEENTKNAFILNKDELKRLTKSKYEKEILKMKDEIGEVKANKILEEYKIKEKLWI